jgi:hypothetical protein
MTKPPTSREESKRMRLEASARVTLRAGDDGWIAAVSKISPILSGVGTFGSFINSVIAARQTAEFQRQLISALQTVEADLEGIKSDLDAIYDELKKIQTQIAGLGLNDKLTAIETWGMELAALDPTDKMGAANLATAMMDASQGSTNLLGCMVGLHNALVGQSIGTPFVNLLDAPGFLQVRARLVQGLHLLAFACAFNTAERYDYSVFLLQWAANFAQATQAYIAANKDYIPQANPYPEFGYGNLNSGDTIVIYQYAQSLLPNVALAADGKGVTLLGYTGTLGWCQEESMKPELSFPATATAPFFQAFFDMVNNEVSNDPFSPLGQRCDPFDYPDQYMSVFTYHLAGERVDEFPKKAKLVCGARFDPNQTFLGAVNGQLSWVGAKDQSTYLCSIHDGDNPGAPLVVFDATKVAVSTQPFSKLQTLAPALWAIAWVSKDVVTVCAQQATAAGPAYLALDASANWTISATPVNLSVSAAAPKIGAITNPFQMPPTAAAIGMASKTRTVLFHQM